MPFSGAIMCRLWPRKRPEAIAWERTRANEEVAPRSNPKAPQGPNPFKTAPKAKPGYALALSRPESSTKRQLAWETSIIIRMKSKSGAACSPRMLRSAWGALATQAMKPPTSTTRLTVEGSRAREQSSRRKAGGALLLRFVGDDRDDVEGVATAPPSHQAVAHQEDEVEVVALKGGVDIPAARGGAHPDVDGATLGEARFRVHAQENDADFGFVGAHDDLAELFFAGFIGVGEGQE